jgi:hypothetical protein
MPVISGYYRTGPVFDRHGNATEINAFEKRTRFAYARAAAECGVSADDIAKVHLSLLLKLRLLDPLRELRDLIDRLPWGKWIDTATALKPPFRNPLNRLHPHFLPDAVGPDGSNRRLVASLPDDQLYPRSLSPSVDRPSALRICSMAVSGSTSLTTLIGVVRMEIGHHESATLGVSVGARRSHGGR